MIQFLAIVGVLGGLIFFHELGHFVTARLLGIGAPVFSIGFGPTLKRFRWGKTEFRLSAIPLGGYVRLAGEAPGQEIEEGVAPGEIFRDRPAWQRMLVVAAGPVSNLILAWFIYWGLFFTQGLPEMLPSVGEIRAGSPAEKAGVRKGDVFVSIEDKPLALWTDLTDMIGKQGKDGRPLTFVIRRGGETLTLQIAPVVDKTTNIFGETITRPLIGVGPSGETRVTRLDFWQSNVQGLIQTWNVMSLTLQSFWKMIAMVVPLDNIGGPIMIGQMVAKQATEGLSHVLSLAALISVNLGLLNLMPIPVLDGGHILFYGLETILGRPVDEKIQAVAMKVGLTMLGLLMGFAIYNDLARILFGL